MNSVRYPKTPKGGSKMQSGRSSYINIVKSCQLYFSFDLPSALKFLRTVLKNSTLNIKIKQTRYAKWLSTCSGCCEFNMMCVEWNCHYFFSFSFVLFLLVHVLFACATILYGE